jgi:hypothetical protein
MLFKLYIVLASWEFTILIRFPEDSIHGMLKYVVGKFCASTVSIPVACKVGFIKRFNEFQIIHTIETLLKEMDVTSSVIQNPKI